MSAPRKLADRPGRRPGLEPKEVEIPALKAERVQETLRAFPGWQVRADGPGLVRRYEFPSVRDSGAFAAFAASLLADLDAVPEVEIVGTTAAVRVASGRAVGEVTPIDLERVAVLEGRAKGKR